MKLDNVNVDVVAFLEGLDIKNVRVVGDEVNFSCPSPDHRNGDSSPSASMNTRTTAWNCFGCGRRGNAITFLSDVEGVNTLVAMRWIREAFGSGPRGSIRGSLARDFAARWAPPAEPAPTLMVNPPLDDHWLEHFSVDWGVAALYQDGLPEGITYPFRRGFTADTLDHFRCGWEEVEGRFVFPLCNTLGYVVGFKGRACNSHTEPRYRVFGKPYYPFETCKVAETVFNADKVERGGHVIVVEGELNCMKLWQLGYRNAVSISGAQMSARQAAIINALATSVTLYFDSDLAGNTGTKIAAGYLHEHMPVSIVAPHIKDAADTTGEGVRNLLETAASITHSYLGYNDYLTTIIEKIKD